MKQHLVSVGFPIAIVAALGALAFLSPMQNLFLQAEDYNMQYSQVPSYFQEAFILTGYRRPGLTVVECWRSMLCLHNETVNIWTHFIAALWFWKQAIHHYSISTKSKQAAEKEATSSQRVPSDTVLSQYCASQATVFSASFIAHTFSPTSTNEDQYQRLWRLDWSMIAVAMLGVSWLLIELAFRGHADKQSLWKRAFFASTGVMFLVVNVPFFTKLPPKWKALGALLPIPTLLCFAWETTRLSRSKIIRPAFLREILLKPMLLAAVGLTVYALQVPERIYPGLFDLSGGSHTFHHLWTATFSFWMLQNAKSFHQHWQPKDDSEEFLLPTSARYF